MVRSFLEAVRDGKDVPVSAELCWAALQSARAGRPVAVPIAPDEYPRYATA